jgi:2-polyprenyl-3-methyl-5-hydroxy-6-metoxy-1,4-benzoquinol methylase
MTQNRLNIISVTSQSSSIPSSPNSRHTRIKELQAKFERLWLVDPERFNPLRNCMERERLERTWQLLTNHVNLRDQFVVDIGCGAGVFSRRLRDAGAQVEAVDIAENALKRFREVDAERIELKQDAMPMTHLPDHRYQVVVCTELIAEIPPHDYRLFFAELSRLIQPDGYLVCSSPIDIDTTGAVERLRELAQSEFDIIEEVASYHALYLRLMRNPCLSPIRKLLKNHHKTLSILEKICRFFWDQEGISHYLFIAKRRVLPKIDSSDIPIERAKKKEIWE